jgi:hypothetical protein
MEQGPPRRTRRRPDRARSFPIVPAILAVLVVGFLIGAALSLFGNRLGSPLALATPSPAPPPSEAPPVPRPPPAARPTALSHLVPLPARTRAHLALASPAAPAPPSPALATPSPQPPAPTPPPTAPPTRVPTSKPSAPPLAQPAEASAGPAATGASQDYADSDFARLSAGVVRSYLGAVMRGDQDSAYAAFGATPGDKGIILTEQGIIDPGTQIVRVDARQTGDNAATVAVDLQTAKGSYFVQYFLKRSPTGAALITNHEIIKP